MHLHAVIHAVLLAVRTVVCAALAAFLAVFRTDLGTIPETALLALPLTKLVLGSIKNPFD